MEDPRQDLTEEEKKVMEETELFMQEVYSDPDVANAQPPAGLRDRVFAQIRSLRTDGEENLVRLERTHRRRLRLQKVAALAAILLMAMAFSVVSMGGPKKVYKMVKFSLAGREQIHVNSEDISGTVGMSEEEAYQEIEERYGFTPVAMYYLPRKVGFLEVKMGDEIQGINLIYGKDRKAKIVYFIRPNYRSGSFGKDLNDDFVEEYTEETESAEIYIRKYMVEGKEERWLVQFEYQEALYLISITDFPKEEVDKIIENLFFS